MWHQCNIYIHYLGGGRLTFLDARRELDLKGLSLNFVPQCRVILWGAGAALPAWKGQGGGRTV